MKGERKKKGKGERKKKDEGRRKRWTLNKQQTPKIF